MTRGMKPALFQRTLIHDKEAARHVRYNSHAKFPKGLPHPHHAGKEQPGSMQRELSDHLRRSVCSSHRSRYPQTHLHSHVCSDPLGSLLAHEGMRACATRAQEIGDALLVAEEEEDLREEKVGARDACSPLSVSSHLVLSDTSRALPCDVCAGLLFCSGTPSIDMRMSGNRWHLGA